MSLYFLSREGGLLLHLVFQLLCVTLVLVNKGKVSKKIVLLIKENLYQKERHQIQRLVKCWNGFTPDNGSSKREKNIFNKKNNILFNFSVSFLLELSGTREDPNLDMQE